MGPKENKRDPESPHRRNRKNDLFQIQVHSPSPISAKAGPAFKPLL